MAKDSECMKKIFVLLILMAMVIASPVYAEKHVPILVYHSIDQFSGHGSKGLYVTPENFQKQMQYLKEHGFTLLTFERWQDRKIVSKPIFITFDDGYKNNLNAFAILQKLKDNHFTPSATIFIISDFVDRSNRLNPEELKMLSRSGIFSIQSHTATHPDLTKTIDYENQLNVSKEKIKKMTGRPVIALSYPYGKYNDRVVLETKKYYLYGLTDSSKQNAKDKDNENFMLPRTYIFYSTTLEEFAQIVNKNE